MTPLRCSIDGCDRTFYALGWCHLHWDRQRRTGTTDPPVRLSFEERFWAYVDYAGPVPADRPELGPCWLWTGHIKTTGYGGINSPRSGGRKTVLLAHRVAFHLLVGPIPEDMELDHLCRVRACCRPSHLEVVTPAENQHRSDSPAGRHFRQTNCVRGHEFTEANTYERPGGGRNCRECNRTIPRAPAGGQGKECRMSIPSRCERCARPDQELALDISCFRYLCQRCWGDDDHVCEECAATLICCPCEGKGCGKCGLTGRGLESGPAVEVEGAA